MQALLSQTTAYQVLCADVVQGKTSHAYLVHYSDEANLRDTLKLFAQKLFGNQADSRVLSLIQKEGFADCRIYPEVGKKYFADEVSEIIEDTALLPMEGSLKVYILDRFHEASPIIQNKLLKTLEEPPKNVVFLLGATTLSPLLDTVKSRVKTLSIPPFSDSAILSALKEKYGEREDLSQAAYGCAGVFGVACAMVEGGWYAQVKADAYGICTARSLADAGKVSQSLGDTPYKTQLLQQVQALYFEAYKVKAGVVTSQEAKKIADLWQPATLVYALELVEKSAQDVKFNAWFQGLLYDLCVKVIKKEQNL